MRPFTMAIATVALGGTVYAQGGMRKEGNLKVGDEAPNFTAKLLGTDESVELNSVLEKEQKPIVLIFGSYT